VWLSLPSLPGRLISSSPCKCGLLR